MSLDAVPPKAAADDVLGRFREIVSDPNNQRIPRVPWAGVIGRDPRFEDPFVVMHNGLRVLMGGYYGAFSQILVINRGVHEPQEELAFSRVLDRIAAGECMVELGAYWGFYSAWFKSRHPENRVFLIEPEPLHLEAGRRNFELNGLEGKFIQGHVGPGGIDLASLMTERSIERLGILHADIQGAEAFLLDSIAPILAAGRIRFLFVSTHTQDLHRTCRTMLESHGYRIIASADFDRETFSCDGVLVAAAPGEDFEPIDLCCRAAGDSIDNVAFME
jgi:hypothetical protein